MRVEVVISVLKMKLGVLFALLPLFTAVIAEAQFVHAGPFTNVGGDRRTLVVATDGDFPNAGLFVAYVDEPFEIQAVNPAKLEKDKTRSFFLVFNKKTNSYSELILQNGESYAIRSGGSFSITMKQPTGEPESTRVSIANSVNPYCSIVISRGSREKLQFPSIAGYVGTQEMISIARNDKAVALLEANQMIAADEYKDLIYDFTLEKNGSLNLNGKPFTAESIGIALPDENACLRQGVEWVNEEALPKGEETTKGKSAIPVRSPDEFLISNISRAYIAALDFKSGDFGVIKERGNFGGKTYCAFSKMAAR